MEPWQQHDQNLHTLAMNLHNTVGRIRQGITPDSLHEFKQVWMKEATDNPTNDPLHSPMMPSAVDMQVEFVLSNLKFRVPEVGDIPIYLNVAQGTVGDQRHKWLELSTHDEIRGPYPSVYIIDPAARGIDPSHILVGPDSPFRLLYRSNARTEFGK